MISYLRGEGQGLCSDNAIAKGYFVAKGMQLLWKADCGQSRTSSFELMKSYVIFLILSVLVLKGL